MMDTFIHVRSAKFPVLPGEEKELVNEGNRLLRTKDDAHSEGRRVRDWFAFRGRTVLTVKGWNTRCWTQRLDTGPLPLKTGNHG